MSNVYVENFYETLRSKFSKADRSKPVGEWICENTSLRGKPFSFKGYEFQRAIADDLHPDLYVRKVSQVGLTEMQLRKFLSLLKRNTGLSGIFTLPNDEMQERVAVRAKVILDTDQIFNEESLNKPVRRKDLIQIDQSFGYFTGSKESDATSIPADFLFHDELDLTDQSMVGLFQSRLQNSQMKVTQHFSTPKFTNFGIDKGYQSSDQYEYFCKCSSCNHYNAPAFDLRHLYLPGLDTEKVDLIELTDDEIEKIDFNEAAVVCERCRSPLELGNPERREWVAKYPGRLVRGYFVSPFSTSRITLPYIFRQLRKQRDLDNTAGFVRTTLGLPFDDDNTRLSEAVISSAFRDPSVPEFKENVFVGIDVGLICHIVIGQPGHAMLFDTVSVEELNDYVEKIMKKYNVIRGAVDRHPYTPTSDSLRDQTNGVILPIEYRGNAVNQKKENELKELSHIQVNRTQAIDAVVAQIKRGHLKLSGYRNQKRIITEHLRDMVRVEEAEKPAVWHKITGNDHYFHALTFFLTAQRVHETLILQHETDQRELVHFGTITNFNQSEFSLNVKNRAKTKIPTYLY